MIAPRVVVVLGALASTSTTTLPWEHRSMATTPTATPWGNDVETIVLRVEHDRTYAELMQAMRVSASLASYEDEQRRRELARAPLPVRAVRGQCVARAVDLVHAMWCVRRANPVRYARGRRGPPNRRSKRPTR